MEIFDSHGWKWRQNANGSWSRWTGSNWVAPDAQYAAPATPGMVGTNPNEYSDNRGFRWSIDANGQHWRWTGSAWIASDASPDYTPPAQNSAPLPHDEMGLPPVPDPNKGQGNNPAPTPPPPDPYQGWNTANAGSRSWRYISPELQAYYEQNPSEVFRQYTADEFGDRQTPQLDYARNNYQDYWAQYIKASEGHPDMHFTDTLSNDLAGQIRNSFQMQSPGQKGYQLSWQPAGRFTG